MSFATGGMVRCCDCGDAFYRAGDENWKIRCIPCFIKKKNKPQESQPAGNFWQRHAEKLAAENAALVAEISGLKGQLWQRMHLEPSGLDREIKENLRALIQLCHPDKHNGSQGATQITQWLLTVKRRLSCG